MSLWATVEESRAYAKLGGAMDDLAGAYPYVAKAISHADTLHHELFPLANSARIPGILKAAGRAQRAYSYVRRIQEVLDEKKRQGGLLKLGIKVSIDIASQILGESLSTHPYYAYHKAMIDALADAVNASRNSRAAVDAYRRAVSAANSTALANEFKRLESRKVDVVVEHYAFKDRIGVAADIARGMMSDEFARKKIAEYGETRLQEAVSDLEAWRAHWSGLWDQASVLYTMAGTQLNAAVEAMKQVKDLVATLMGGSNTSRVMGYGAVENIEWEKYDEIVNRKTPDLAMMDPVAFAQTHCDKAAAWAKAFAEMCDFARGSDVLFPSKFEVQLGSLDRTLYG